MSHVEKNLAPNEKIIHRTQMHPIAYTGPVFLALIGLSVLTMGQPGIGLATTTLLAAALWAGITFLQIKSSEYVLTDKRVIIKTGIINIETFEILLNKVGGINLQEGLIEEKLGYGNIVVRDTGSAQKKFKNIIKAGEFKTAIYKQIEENKN